MGQPRRAVRRLGGVLGDVGGDGDGVGGVGGLEGTHVDLGAPAGPDERGPTRRGGTATWALATAARTARVEHVGVEPGRRGFGRSLGPVGPEDDVEVDQTPVLELDHLHVGEPGDRPQLGGARARRRWRPGGRGDGRCAPTGAARARSTAPPRGSRSTRGRAGRRGRRRRRSWREPARERPPVGTGARSGGAGRPGAHPPSVGPLWTGPNDGAVRVTKSWGCSTTAASTPLPPRIPAATSCQASAW